MKPDLVKRLREAAQVAWDWDDPDMNPPLIDWSDLMKEAANAIDELQDDAPYNEPREYTDSDPWVGHHPNFSFDSMVEQADADASEA